MAYRKLIIPVLTLVFPLPWAAGQRIIHVDDDATGIADGTSWVDAYPDLQDAIDEAAQLEGAVEIWVAQGTYKPDRGTGDRTASFCLMNDVALYGGFVGTESTIDERNWDANPTVLSGDLNGDDDPDLIDSDSTCCVETNEPGCDDAECIARVVQDSSGDHCAFFWDDFCVYLAKAYCCDVCSPTRCENTYSVVDGSHVDDSARLDGFTVTAGEANSPDTSGGGISADDGFPTIANCTLFDNAAAFAGGGLWVSRRTNETTVQQLTNCTFANNEVYASLAGGAYISGGRIMLSNCMFYRNRRGGGLYSSFRTQMTTLVDCSFIENQALSGGGAKISRGLTATNCDFYQNEAGSVGALAIRDFAEAKVTNSTFIGNRARGTSGAVSISSFSSAVFENCLFSGNWAGSPTNDGFAGAIFTVFSSVVLRNCTVTGNSAGSAGGIALSNASIAIDRCIFWGNTDHRSQFDEERTQIYGGNHSQITINHSCVEDWSGELGGVGNIGADPLFVDADGPDDVLGTQDDNLRLLPDSPGIDNAGTAPDQLGTADLDGHPRFLCGRIDMGPYEFGIGDFNCSQSVDLDDFSGWESCSEGPDDNGYPLSCAAFDFNADNRVDLSDFAGFQRAIFAADR